MKSAAFKGMLAVAIALPTLGGVARAGGTEDFGCSNATLRGDYAFSVVDLTTQSVGRRSRGVRRQGRFCPDRLPWRSAADRRYARLQNGPERQLQR